jgi:hypothetical protein
VPDLPMHWIEPAVTRRVILVLAEPQIAMALAPMAVCSFGFPEHPIIEKLPSSSFRCRRWRSICTYSAGTPTRAMSTPNAVMTRLMVSTLSWSNSSPPRAICVKPDGRHRDEVGDVVMCLPRYCCPRCQSREPRGTPHGGTVLRAVCDLLLALRRNKVCQARRVRLSHPGFS